MWIVLAFIACGGEPAPAIPVAASAPVVPMVASIPCTPSEQVLFSCPAGNGKSIVVCGENGKVQYRFGGPGNVELAYPVDGDPKKLTYEERSYAQAQATVLSFQNEGVTYEITDSIGGGGENGASNNFQGVYVTKGSDPAIPVPCMLPPVVAWDQLKGGFSTTSP